MIRYFLCFILLFAVSGCQKSSSGLDQWIQPNGKIKVLSSTPIIDDLVGQIGGDRIDHLSLIEGAMDPHSYEMVKGDAEKLSYAQIIFYHGLGLEHGASLRGHLKEHPKAVALGDKIREEHPEMILSKRGQVDPHIWLDIALWSEAVNPIVDALSDIDPSNSLYFKERGAQVKQSLMEIDAILFGKLQNISSEKRYLVTSHDAFNYFTRRYLAEGSNWEDRFCAPEGLAPDGQLSCHDIQLVIDHLAQHRISVIFPESNISRESLKKIFSVCHEKGMKVELCKESLCSDSFGAAKTYQAMMEHNVEILCKAWE